MADETPEKTERERIVIVGRNKEQEPLRWADNVTKNTDPKCPNAVMIWMALRTVPSQGTAVALHELHDQYFEDFYHFVRMHGQTLLTEEELLHVLTEGTRTAGGSGKSAGFKGKGAMGFEIDEFEGRTLVVGVDWATMKDTQAFAKQFGVQLSIKQDAPVNHLASLLKESKGKASTSATGLGTSSANEATEITAEDPDLLDPDGDFRTWMNEVLVRDDGCATGAGDVWMAFKRKFTEDMSEDFESMTYPLSMTQLLSLVQACFPHISFRKTPDVFDIRLLRWKKLPSGTVRSICVHPFAKDFPEEMREEASWLLYLKLKERVHMWQFQNLEELKGYTISLRSLWRMYLLAFARSADTHHRVGEKRFFRILKASFPGVEKVKVSEDYPVVLNLATRDTPVPPQDLLSIERMTDFARENLTPNTSKERNVFNQKLAEQPLLALSRRRRSNEFAVQTRSNNSKRFDGAAAPGPFIQRIRRRAHDPPLPLGDEEPGFPGVSLKRESRRLKGQVEAYREFASRTLEGDPSLDPKAT